MLLCIIKNARDREGLVWKASSHDAAEYSAAPAVLRNEIGRHRPEPTPTLSFSDVDIGKGAKQPKNIQ